MDQSLRLLGSQDGRSSVDGSGTERRTALWKAAEAGHTEAVRVLLVEVRREEGRRFPYLGSSISLTACFIT